MIRHVLAGLACALAATSPTLAATHWTLDVDGDGALLTTGAPRHGQVGVTAMNCAGGERVADLFFTVRHRVMARMQDDVPVNAAGEAPPWNVRVTVRSGRFVGRFAGHALPDEETGGSSIEATVPMASPVMRAFARTGRLRLTAYGVGPVLPAAPPARVARFARVCLQP
jgi:hypothetical protein